MDGKKSWHDANGWCMKNGGWLLKLDTKEEGRLVATEVELQNLLFMLQIGKNKNMTWIALYPNTLV